MAKRSGMYNQKKRQKELARKKKQEAKRLKRQKDKALEQSTEETTPANVGPESSGDTPEAVE
ncbi:MAG TPA: hypothetical protein ENG95_02015 [Nitrospirae bacterium]|nr:hypothetical protein BMS3Abin10_00989 [bacterium BMS3Abin10]GBE39218.1 hypothetical protein BMS3Bbin08_01839 [bacterium BMS3Bbin08]HDH50476.1 hypothetical protein [Nitrospirota bacterium]HDK16734.1 hypothetical protein [Nitrospirota bacterium]HDK81852.1 hypothetical protein [Nitrospirota bacterium]